MSEKTAAKKGSKSSEETKPPKKTGRPPKITEAIQEEILTRLSAGESARSICRDSHMPEWSVLCKHKRVKENEDFCNQYAQARKEGMLYRMDMIWEKVQDTSRDVIFDEIERLDKDGNIKSIEKIAKSDNTAVNRDRLIADQARWEAARIYKDLFGDKVINEHTGADGGAIKYEQVVDKPPKETPEEWQKRVQQQLAEKAKQLIQ
jgi:hypothetical protein